MLTIDFTVTVFVFINVKFVISIMRNINNSNAQRLALAASGRDAEKARKRNPTEALKTAKKRGDSHLSAPRCVGQLLLFRRGKFLNGEILFHH